MPKFDPKKFVGRCRAAKTPKQRLKLLADALERKALYDHLNFRWDFLTMLRREGYEEWDGDVTIYSTAKELSKAHPCGTVGCALGMAAHLFPEFRKVARRFGSNAGGQVFFGLDEVEMDDAFFSSRKYGFGLPVEPKHVAARLRKLAKEM